MKLRNSAIAILLEAIGLNNMVQRRFGLFSRFVCIVKNVLDLHLRGNGGTRFEWKEKAEVSLRDGWQEKQQNTSTAMHSKNNNNATYVSYLLFFHKAGQVRKHLIYLHQPCVHLSDCKQRKNF